MLDEWARVLVSGGKITIMTPDIERICEVLYPQAKAGKISWERLSAIINGGQDYEGNFHHVSFSFLWLKQLLEEAGFTKVSRTVEHTNQNMTLQAFKS